MGWQVENGVVRQGNGGGSGGQRAVCTQEGGRGQREQTARENYKVTLVSWCKGGGGEVGGEVGVRWSGGECM